LLRRIKTWDELRGVAISFMIFVHFFYFNSRGYYQLNIFDLLHNISGGFELLKGILNLHTSYLAPFLFLFIVGIISHIKFRKQTGPDLTGALKRFFKLYLSTLLLVLIFSFNQNRLTNITILGLVISTFRNNNILMIIAYVYLMNEFILHSLFNYYRQKLLSKMLFILFFGIAIIIFNIYTKTVYPTYHALPLYVVILSGFFNSLLGDLFISVDEEKNIKHFGSILIYYILMPIGICAALAVLEKPAMGSIKQMNLIYFIYCFALTVLIIEAVNVEFNSKIFRKMKETLSLMGRHSLGLYIFHFFIGLSIEKYVLIKFVPKPYWPMNIVLIFVACIVMAKFLDKVQSGSFKRSSRMESTI